MPRMRFSLPRHERTQRSLHTAGCHLPFLLSLISSSSTHPPPPFPPLFCPPARGALLPAHSIRVPLLTTEVGGWYLLQSCHGDYANNIIVGNKQGSVLMDADVEIDLEEFCTLNRLDPLPDVEEVYDLLTI